MLPCLPCTLRLVSGSRVMVVRPPFFAWWHAELRKDVEQRSAKGIRIDIPAIYFVIFIIIPIHTLHVLDPKNPSCIHIYSALVV